MPFSEQNPFSFNHVDQIDTPLDDATTVKQLWDSRGNEIRTAFNGLISALNATAAAASVGFSPNADVDPLANSVQKAYDALVTLLHGAGGATWLKSVGIVGLTGDNVQTLLESLKSYIDTHKDSSDHDERYYTETESDTKFETKDAITTNRKLSPTGNFTGTLNGAPITSTDPGLSSTVVAMKGEGAAEEKANLSLVNTHLADLATDSSPGHVQVGANIDVLSGIISVKDSSTTQKGIVQLQNTIDTSESKALTPKALNDHNAANIASFTLKADKTYVDTQIQSVASGSPKGTYANITALSAAYPTGNTNIYLTTDNGNWNYWNGAAWTAGGVYQSTGITNDSLTNDMLSDTLKVTQNIGFANESQSFNVNGMSTGVWIFFTSPAKFSGRLKLVEQFCAVSGYGIKITVGSISGNVYTERKRSGVITVNNGTVNILEEDLDILAGEYIGINAQTADVFKYFTDATKSYYYAGTSDITALNTTTGYGIPFNVTLLPARSADFVVLTNDGDYMLFSKDGATKKADLKTVNINKFGFENTYSFYTGKLSNAVTYVLPNAASFDGFLKYVDQFSIASGQCYVTVGAISGSTYIERKRTIALDIINGRVDLSLLHFDVQVGEYIGILVTESAKYSHLIVSASGTQYYTWNGTILTAVTGYGIPFNVTIFDAIHPIMQNQALTYDNKKLVLTVNSVDKSTVIMRDASSAQIEKITNFSLCDWTIPTDWSIGAGGEAILVSTADALANALKGAFGYAFDRRVLSWIFSHTDANTESNFFTYTTESVSKGSLIKISGSTLSIMAGVNTTNFNTLTVVQSYPLGFTISTTKKYKLEIEKDGRTLKIRLFGIETPEYFECTRTAYPLGFIERTGGTSTYGYDQGALQGSPAVVATIGGIKVYEFEHVVLAKEYCKLYTIGDSITEGFAVTDSQKYGGLLRTIMGDREVIMSGIGGDLAQNGYTRIQKELVIIKPEYALIYFGSNQYANDNTMIGNMVTFCKNNGIIPICCTVPTNASVSNYLLGLNDPAVKIVHFDTYLTTGGAGTGTKIIAYYSNVDSLGNPYTDDDLHPNATGHQMMLNRIKLDVPELFN